MKIGDVNQYSRTVTTRSVTVENPSITIILSIDDQGVARVTGQFRIEDPGPRFKLAEFHSRYLPEVHAAIGAVLEAMEENNREGRENHG